MSLATAPQDLTDRPGPTGPGGGDLMSEALRHVRITHSMQYCYMPSGDWVTDATPGAYKPKDCVSFHILAAGQCWIEMDGRRQELLTGDIACFPYGTPHWLGAGTGGRLIDPGGDLPPAPWPETPVLVYDAPAGQPGPQARILCGYVQCDAVNFPMFRAMLPRMIHVRTLGPEPDWLAATLRQIIIEVDRPQVGSQSVLERLTEVALLEVLRRQLQMARPQERGWLAGLADPVLRRCLQALHADPWAHWTLDSLARTAGLSRSVLSQRFSTVLGTAPMRYLRDWRLFLTGLRLRAEPVPILQAALEAGYGSEAAFTRAFTRFHGRPPAEWRRATGA